MDRGLVDELGGIEKAITVAANQLLKDYKLTEVSGSKDFFKDLLEKELDEVKVNMVEQVLGDEYEYVKSTPFNQIGSGYSGTRLPYDVQPL